MITRRTMLLAALAPALGFACFARPAFSAEPTVPRPDGTILQVSGAIAGGSASFDLAALTALGVTDVVTATPWSKGRSTFEGVRLDVLMQRLGCHGTTVRAYALDDYYVEMPVSDFAKFGPILAYKRDGSYLSIVDRGPLWVIYPFDSRPVLSANLYYGRSVWQLQRLLIS